MMVNQGDVSACQRAKRLSLGGYLQHFGKPMGICLMQKKKGKKKRKEKEEEEKEKEEKEEEEEAKLRFPMSTTRDELKVGLKSSRRQRETSWVRLLNHLMLISDLRFKIDRKMIYFRLLRGPKEAINPSMPLASNSGRGQ
jgi:ribosomal protein L9